MPRLHPCNKVCAVPVSQCARQPTLAEQSCRRKVRKTDHDGVANTNDGKGITRHVFADKAGCRCRLRDRAASLARHRTDWIDLRVRDRDRRTAALHSEASKR